MGWEDLLNQQNAQLLQQEMSGFDPGAYLTNAASSYGTDIDSAFQRYDNTDTGGLMGKIGKYAPYAGMTAGLIASIMGATGSRGRRNSMPLMYLAKLGMNWPQSDPRADQERQLRLGADLNVAKSKYGAADDYAKAMMDADNWQNRADYNASGNQSDLEYQRQLNQMKRDLEMQRYQNQMDLIKARNNQPPPAPKPRTPTPTDVGRANKAYDSQVGGFQNQAIDLASQVNPDMAYGWGETGVPPADSLRQLAGAGQPLGIVEDNPWWFTGDTTYANQPLMDVADSLGKWQSPEWQNQYLNTQEPGSYWAEHPEYLNQAPIQGNMPAYSPPPMETTAPPPVQAPNMGMAAGTGQAQMGRTADDIVAEFFDSFGGQMDPKDPVGSALRRAQELVQAGQVPPEFLYDFKNELNAQGR